MQKTASSLNPRGTATHYYTSSNMEKLLSPALLLSLLAISMASASPVSRNTTTSITQRIFQGSTSNTIYPFFVSIVGKVKGKGKDEFGILCGASLIDKTHILTAAHCAEDMTEGMKNGSIFEAWLAPTSLHPPKCQQRIEIASVDDIHASPEYNSTTLANDIAVITLSKPAKMNKHVSAVSIGVYSNYVSLPVTFAGFGNTDCNHSSNFLRSAFGTSIDRYSCQPWRDVSPQAVCAKLWTRSNEYAEADSGDSGGPLFTTQGSKAIQIGIASFIQQDNTGCPDENYPGVYTVPGSFEKFLKQYADVKFSRER